jgi:acyl-CoA thioesterase FadM
LLQVSAQVIESKGATLVIEQRATKLTPLNQETIELCSGTIKIAWVQVGTLKPSRIPKDIIEKLI